MGLFYSLGYICTPSSKPGPFLNTHVLYCTAWDIYMYPILRTRSLPEYTCTVLYSLGYICTPSSEPCPFLNTHVLYCTAWNIYVPHPPNRGPFLNTHVLYFTAWDIYVPHPSNQVPSWIHMYCTVQLGKYMYSNLQIKSLLEYSCIVLYIKAWDIYVHQPPDQVPFWINMNCTVQLCVYPQIQLPSWIHVLNCTAYYPFLKLLTPKNHLVFKRGGKEK